MFNFSFNSLSSIVCLRAQNVVKFNIVAKFSKLKRIRCQWKLTRLFESNRDIERSNQSLFEKHDLSDFRKSVILANFQEHDGTRCNNQAETKFRNKYKYLNFANSIAIYISTGFTDKW